MPVANDTNWLNNNFRSYFFLRISKYIFVEDRNLFISKNLKFRACSLNLSRDMFKINKNYKDREINIIIVGRTIDMDDRTTIINFLKNKNINLHISNRDEKYLNRKDYFNLLQNSKILINFNKAPSMNKIHFVGRVNLTRLPQVV